MFLSTFAMLAFATVNPGATPIDATPAAQAIGCHPQPGKVMGCVTNSHVVAQQRAMGTHRPVVALADETVERTIACHPDPSRNRGCFRPAPGAKVKAAVAVTAPKADTARAETPAAPSETQRKAS